MKYKKYIYYSLDYRQQKRSIKMARLLTSFSVFLLLAGIYVGSLAVSPRLSFIPGSPIRILTSARAESSQKENLLRIEKIGANLKIGTDSNSLETGVWHRFPDRVPERGGNIVLAGHRFEIGWTPEHTRAKSPFYKLNTLEKGDIIVLDYDGQSYHYIVDKLYNVRPDEIWIEDNTNTHKLTLYTCGMGGTNDNRLVVEALPL